MIRLFRLWLYGALASACVMRLALLLLLIAPAADAQTARTYLQVWFRNGGAHVVRDAAGLLVTIGSATDPRRVLNFRPAPTSVLALTVLMQGPLPADTAQFQRPQATWRCAPSGCWVTIMTPGLGSYFRPSPNVQAVHLAAIRLALVSALQGNDVPNVVLDLR